MGAHPPFYSENTENGSKALLETRQEEKSTHKNYSTEGLERQRKLVQVLQNKQ